MTTQELSDKYDSLFTPIGFTFSIWSVIYTLLLIFSIVPLVNYFRGKKNTFITKNIGYLFPLSCLMNGAWILAWQYQFVGLSVIIMLGLLTTLITLHRNIQKTNG